MHEFVNVRTGRVRHVDPDSPAEARLEASPRWEAKQYEPEPVTVDADDG